MVTQQDVEYAVNNHHNNVLRELAKHGIRFEHELSEALMCLDGQPNIEVCKFRLLQMRKDYGNLITKMLDKKI
jgi:hypothetical protein